RLQAANGNGRYQFWQSALHANATHPWRGIGPGTFQFWWGQHATVDGFIRNAHSLYFETLAETGIIGFTLLGGLLLWFVGVAVRRALREPPMLRLQLAAASASLAVFLFSAAIEWVWQLAAIAAAALLLGAVIVAGRAEAPQDWDQPQPEVETGGLGSRLVPRSVLALLAIAALGAVLVPFAGQLAVRDSQAAAADGNLAAALQDSLAAERLQPYASNAYLQEALVLEAAADLGPAATAARIATTNSPTDWTTWLTLARIDARRGATDAALAELRRARELNPLSVLFVQT
ncbi:MAG: O-antigen ligase family protein, partial [Solirubrobacteraceae bacterium]